VFITDNTVVVPAETFPCKNSSCGIPGTATGTVTASDPGVSYNGASGPLSGSPSGISAQLASPTSGGTDNIVTVVTADDVQKASVQLAQQSTDTIKQQLTKQFTNGEVVIADSFTTTAATPVSTPAVDTQATDGKAKLVASTTYSIIGIAKPDLELFLNDSLTKQLTGNTSQRVYDDGISKVWVSGYNKAADGSATIKINSTGQIGPTIDEAKLKDQIKGKIFGDVQSIVSAIPGVDSVDVQFSYPWVRNVPNDVKKITIQFKVNNAQ
jgi:hypothetical protein